MSTARQNMIQRMLRRDADDEEEEEENPTPVRGGKNTRLPFGLCKEYNIGLPEDAEPHDAWEALKDKTGITPEDAYEQMKKTGHASDIKPVKRKSTAVKKGKVTVVANPQDFESKLPLSPYAKYSQCLITSNLRKANTKELYATGADGYKCPMGSACENVFVYDGYKAGLERTKKVLSELPAGAIVTFDKGKDNLAVHYIKTEKGKWMAFHTQAEFEEFNGARAEGKYAYAKKELSLTNNSLAEAIATEMKQAWGTGLKIAEITEEPGKQFSIYNPSKDMESVKGGEASPAESCVKHPTPKNYNVSQVEKFLREKANLDTVTLSKANGMTDEAARQISDAVISVVRRYRLSNLNYINSDEYNKHPCIGAEFSDGYFGSKICFFDVKESPNSIEIYTGAKRTEVSCRNLASEMAAKLESAETSEKKSYYTSMLEYYKQKAEEAAEEAKKPGYTYWTVGEEGQYALTTALHELGHAVSEKYFRLSLGKKLIRETRMKAVKNGDIYKISEYASTVYKKSDYPDEDSRYDEFFAECFVAYHLKWPLPQYIKDMIEYADYAMSIADIVPGKDYYD